MKLFKLIRTLPVLGTILLITNSYVYNGDANSSEKFAPLKLWLKKFFSKTLFVSLMTALVYIKEIADYFSLKSLSQFIGEHDTVTPGAIITSSFPSLIGFGIGVYALIFALDKSVIKHFQDAYSNNKKKKYGSVLILSSDLAYPLIVLIITLGIGIFQVIFLNSSLLCLITWFSMWYSFVMIIEMLGVLFGLTNNSLLDKL